MMIGHIDRHGQIDFPACPQVPAQRKRWPASLTGILLWLMAGILVISLTASVTTFLRQPLLQPDVPADELILGPGLGNAR